MNSSKLFQFDTLEAGKINESKEIGNICVYYKLIFTLLILLLLPKKNQLLLILLHEVKKIFSNIMRIEVSLDRSILVNIFKKNGICEKALSM